MSMLLAATLAAPVAILLAGLSARARPHLPRLLALAPLPGLAASVLAIGGEVTLPRALLGMRLALDVPGAILLGVSTLIWIAAGLFAGATMPGQPGANRFAAWWLATLTGSLGIFMAADLVSFYLLFAVVSLPAYWLVAHAGTPGARRAGAVYVGMAIFGEALLLMGFVLLAAGTPGDSILIRDAVAALPGSPWRDSALALLIGGFGVKMALLGLHVWMPLSYTEAPIPAAAALSGAAVKAGVIGLIRFLPIGTAMPGWGEALVALGFAGAFYGVAVGLTQANPRTMLAYSSISQMGVIAAVLGMGLANGEGAVLPASLYAANHVLAKGGLFLAIGMRGRMRGRIGSWLVLAPAALLALGLAGLPLTGGAVAKYVVKEPLGDGPAGLLGTLSAIATALLMIHFLVRLASLPPGKHLPRDRAVPAWLGTALAGLLVPWALLLAFGAIPASALLSPPELWAAAWPVLAGSALAIALLPWRGRLPAIPPGDIVVFADGAGRAGGWVSAALARWDALLREWPVAGVSLLAIAAALVALLR